MSATASASEPPDRTLARISAAATLPLLGGRQAPLVEHHHLAELNLLGLAELLEVLAVVAALVLLVHLDPALHLAAPHLLHPQLAAQLGAELGLGHAGLRQGGLELLVAS